MEVTQQELSTRPITEHLKYTLDLVFDFVKFAEAKLGVLLALQGAGLVGLFQWLPVDGTLMPLAQACLVWEFAILLVGMCVCLAAFLPQTSNHESSWQVPMQAGPKAGTSGAHPQPLRRSQRDVTALNLMLYSHLSGVSSDIYLNEICRRYFDGEALTTGLDRDLANQIVVNSRIAMRKYRLFTAALLVSAAAVLLPLGLLLASRWYPELLIVAKP